MIQHTEYKQETENLLNNVPVSRNSKSFVLNPFVDTDGLLRVGGRLANADIPYAEQLQLTFCKTLSLCKSCLFVTIVFVIEFIPVSSYFAPCFLPVV
jgi:hypothetical protein